MMRINLSPLFAWLCLIAALVVGLPLFMRSPVWVDVTYHDLSARNILWGGVHYRDIFETNLPGMVWLHIAARSLLGWSFEAIRLADLVMVGSSIVLLTLWLRRLNLSGTSQVWFVFAAVFFYLFQSEYIQCQRDGWMLLPTVLGLLLRAKQVERAADASGRRLFGWGILEGACWACAVWIKPHSLVPAFFVWLVSHRRIAGGIALRPALLDFFGLLLGGGLVGALGSFWLWKTGTWTYLWDVLLHWNPEYYQWTQREMEHRLSMVLSYFGPWSLIHLVAIPLAIRAVIRGKPLRKQSPKGSDREPVRQALLAALYLGWLAEATFLQKSFHYSQAPVILLALAVLANHRLPVGPIFLIWCFLSAVLLEVAWPSKPVRDWVDQYDAWIPAILRQDVAGFIEDHLAEFRSAKPYTFVVVVARHAAFDPDRLALWPRCFRESSPELRDALRAYTPSHCVPTWTDLAKVEEFLQTKNLKDGELVCWYDATHPLYLDLHLRPGIRYMHVNTAMDFRSKLDKIQAELAASPQRYVVSDLYLPRLYFTFNEDSPEGQPNALPTDFPNEMRNIYPWNQPVVFRAGSYFVHEVTRPIGTIQTPIPKKVRHED